MFDRLVDRAWFVVAVMVGVGGCRSAADRRVESRIDAMVAGATGCPAPATCGRRVEASGRVVAVCAPEVGVERIAVGDVVATSEMKNHTSVGVVTARRGDAIVVEFPDGSSFERSADRVVGRVCRP